MPRRGVALLVALFVLPCVLMFASTLLALRSQQSMQVANRWVQHTGEVMALLHSFDADAAQFGMSARSFLLARRQADAEGAGAAGARLRADLPMLRQLTADNHVQQANLEKLTPLVTRRVAIAEQAIALERTGRHDEAVTLALSPENEGLITAVNATCGQMIQEERVRLAERQQRVVEILHRRTIYSWTMLGANTLVLLSVIVLLSWFRKLQEFVRICAWSRTVEYNGEWLSFEKYLQARFGLNTSHGISPEEASKIFESVTAATRTPGAHGDADKTATAETRAPQRQLSAHVRNREPGAA